MGSCMSPTPSRTPLAERSLSASVELPAFSLLPRFRGLRRGRRGPDATLSRARCSERLSQCTRTRESMSCISRPQEGQRECFRLFLFLPSLPLLPFPSPPSVSLSLFLFFYEPLPCCLL